MAAEVTEFAIGWGHSHRPAIGRDLPAIRGQLGYHPIPISSSGRLKSIQGGKIIGARPSGDYNVAFGVYSCSAISVISTATQVSSVQDSR